MSRQRVTTYPSATTRADSSPIPPAGVFNFTTMSTQNPLTAGGVLSGATNGYGGNVPCTILSDMRVALASDGLTKVAMADVNGQDSPYDYMDSIAFLPGVSLSGDFTITAILYKEAGYVVTQHELEIVIGVRSYVDGSSRVCHSLMEMLLNASGGADIIRRGGGAGGSYTGANNDFQAYGAQIDTVVPEDGMEWVCRKQGTTYTSELNGTLIATYTGAQSGLGTGGGIGAFWRPLSGAVSNKYGFRYLRVIGA